MQLHTHDEKFRKLLGKTDGSELNLQGWREITDSLNIEDFRSGLIETRIVFIKDDKEKTA